MIVTINTDASFSKRKNRGSFAVWMVSSLGRYTHSGPLRPHVREPWQAEMMAIVNALHLYNKTGWAQQRTITKIILNTDCMSAIHVFTQNTQMLARYGEMKRKGTKNIYDVYHKMASQLPPIEFRHVKAHTNKTDARSYVNNWCDREAKKHIEKITGQPYKP